MEDLDDGTLFLSFGEATGDDDIRSMIRLLCFGAGSSSPDEEGEDEGNTLRFRRFVGGAIAAKLTRSGTTSVCVKAKNQVHRLVLVAAPKLSDGCLC